MNNEVQIHKKRRRDRNKKEVKDKRRDFKRRRLTPNLTMGKIDTASGATPG